MCNVTTVPMGEFLLGLSIGVAVTVVVYLLGWFFDVPTELPTTDDESAREHDRWCLCTCDHCWGAEALSIDGQEAGDGTD